MPPLRSRREMWLLALLVLRHDRDTSRDWLAATLWPDNDEQQALFYLRKGLSNLRKALGSEANRLLSPTARTVRFDLANAFADVVVFSTEDLTERASHYRGPLLPDCQEEWAAVERGHFEQTYLTTLEKLAQTDTASATRWLRLLVSADPYRESAYRALMQALSDLGDRAAVKQTYQELQSKLHQDLNTGPSPETEALYRELRQRERQTLPARENQPNPKRRLPVPLTDLIGRERDIAELLSWLKRRRLVTLVGAGGIGKTRLSIALAEAALPQFEEGAWFIDLAALTDPELVPYAAGKSLGIPEERGRPINETIKDALAGRQILLVLDNCEHVLDPCADLATFLLAQCPDLCIVATSRQPLQVTGEQVYRVPSLAIPTTEDLEALRESEAVRLFADRATHVNSDFRLTPRNVADVAEICGRLDGIALAIEMAAARLRSLSLAEIKARLADRFKLLSTGTRGVLPRQQTLRAAIDWSYDQLSEPERILLGRASVFRGGWTLEAAEFFGDPDTLELLGKLAEKSLVVADIEEDSTRYGLLETVRQYAQYKLDEAEEAWSAKTRHCEFFLSLVESIAPNLRGPQQSKSHATLEADLENIRAAIAFGMERDPAIGLRFGKALWLFWADRGYMREGREILAKMLARQGPASELRADALHGAGILSFLQSDYDVARSLHEESLEISERLGYRRGIAAAYNGLGNVAVEVSDYPTARARYTESLAMHRELDNQSGVVTSLLNLGRVASQAGDYPTARVLHEECLAIYRATEDLQGESRSLYHLAIVTFCENNFEGSLELAEQSLTISRDLGHLQGMADSLNVVALAATEFGDLSRAVACHEEGLAVHRSLGNKWGVGTALVNLGSILQKQGNLDSAREHYLESLRVFAELKDRRVLSESIQAIASIVPPDRAVQLYAAATSMRDAAGAQMPPKQQREYEKEIADLQELVGDKAFDEMWKRGHKLTMQEAIDLASL